MHVKYLNKMIIRMKKKMIMKYLESVIIHCYITFVNYDDGCIVQSIKSYFHRPENGEVSVDERLQINDISFEEEI